MSRYPSCQHKVATPFGAGTVSISPEVVPGDGYYYLATPYSKYPGGLEMAYVEACRAAGKLIESGIRVFSPIAHTHAIARFGNIDPLSHAIWLPADKPLMDAARGLIVVTMVSWTESVGIAAEIDEFNRHGKPIHFMGWDNAGY